MAFDAAAPVQPPMQAASASAKSPVRKDDVSDPFGALLAMLDGAQTETPSAGAPRPAKDKPEEATEPVEGAAPADPREDVAADETKPAPDAAASDQATLVAAMMAPAATTPAPTAETSAATPATPNGAVVAKLDPTAANAQGDADAAAPAPQVTAQAADVVEPPPPAEPPQTTAVPPEPSRVATESKPTDATRSDAASTAEAGPKAPSHAVAAREQGQMGDGGDGRPSDADVSQQARNNDLAAAPSAETATFAAAAADAPAPAIGATQAAASAPVIAAQAAVAPVRGAPETVAHLAAQMIQRLDGRTTRFDLTLNPQSLGRVDVRIEIGAKGALRARMAFDDAATAQELSGRHTELRAALQSAGFDVPEGALSFDVASGGSGGGAFAERQDADRGAAPVFQNLADAVDQDPAVAVRNYFSAAGSSGVDIRV